MKMPTIESEFKKGIELFFKWRIEYHCETIDCRYIYDYNGILSAIELYLPETELGAVISIKSGDTIVITLKSHGRPHLKFDYYIENYYTVIVMMFSIVNFINGIDE